MKSIPIRINKGTRQEKMIGMLYPEEKLFVKTVYGSRHLFRVLDAWGVDARYFTRVLLPNDYLIKVIDKETNQIYLAKASKVKKEGEFYHFKKEGEDDKAQIFLSRKFWEKPKAKTKEEELEEMSKSGIFG